MNHTEDNMGRVRIIEVMTSLKEAYLKMCAPLCAKLGMPQPALDILMFLANNPDYCTAGEICRYKCIKANLVSLYVEKLVSAGYLDRADIKGDRRRVRLVCTGKAGPIIEAGRKLQLDYLKEIMSGVTEEDRLVMVRCHEKLAENSARIINGKSDIKSSRGTDV